jgi:hypothetical protein
MHSHASCLLQTLSTANYLIERSYTVRYVSTVHYVKHVEKSMRLAILTAPFCRQTTLAVQVHPKPPAVLPSTDRSQQLLVYHLMLAALCKLQAPSPLVLPLALYQTAQWHDDSTRAGEASINQVMSEAYT